MAALRSTAQKTTLSLEMSARELHALKDSSLRMVSASRLNANLDSSSREINAQDSPVLLIRRQSVLLALTDVVQIPNGTVKAVRLLHAKLDSSSKTELVFPPAPCKRDLMSKRRFASEFHAELVTRRSMEPAKRSSVNPTRSEEETIASLPDALLKDKSSLTVNAFNQSALLENRLSLKTVLKSASLLTAHRPKDSSETSDAELDAKNTSITILKEFALEFPAQSTKF